MLLNEHSFLYEYLLSKCAFAHRRYKNKIRPYTFTQVIPGRKVDIGVALPQVHCIDTVMNRREKAASEVKNSFARAF